jgi:hypothetical protein
VKNAEDHKQQVAAHVDVGDLGVASALCAAGEKDDAGAEEHGEKATHLAFEEHPLNEKEHKVDADVGPSENVDWKSNGYVMDYFGIAKEIDVHYENTQQSHAAQDIDAGESVGADCGKYGCDVACDLPLVESKPVGFFGDGNGVECLAQEAPVYWFELARINSCNAGQEN